VREEELDPASYSHIGTPCFAGYENIRNLNDPPPPSLRFSVSQLRVLPHYLPPLAPHAALLKQPEVADLVRTLPDDIPVDRV